MRRAWVLTLTLSGLAAAGCPADLTPELLEKDPTASSGAPATEDPLPTSGGSGVVTTTAGLGTSTGPDDDTGEPSTSSTSTGEEPAAVPEIEAWELGPNPLETPGAMALKVTTKNATKVTMQVKSKGGTGPEVTLDVDDVDVFAGELVFASSMANGDDYVAHLVPHGGNGAGFAVDVPFSVALPGAGEESFWESIDALGKGQVVALTVLPDDDVVEFGTLTATSQCYVRRRRPTGVWTMKDDVWVLPQSPCAAIDVAATPAGELYLLTSVGGPKDPNWRLERAGSFGGALSYVRQGVSKEVAYALALGADRAVVCGTRPGGINLDATAWMFPFGKAPTVAVFDYVPPGVMEKDKFAETPRDCVIAGDTLAFAGEVYGQHDAKDPNEVYTNRLLLLEYAWKTDTVTWMVDEPDQGVQSGSRAIAVDPKGGYYVGGYTCTAPCVARVGDLRRYAPNGAISWYQPLAPQLVPPRAIAWHPGGYVALVSAKVDTPFESAFLVQAWRPYEYPALWAYDKKVLDTLHEASAIVIGPFGQVYAGGVGSAGYPAVAFIFG